MGGGGQERGKKEPGVSIKGGSRVNALLAYGLGGLVSTPVIAGGYSPIRRVLRRMYLSPDKKAVRLHARALPI